MASVLGSFLRSNQTLSALITTGTNQKGGDIADTTRHRVFYVSESHRHVKVLTQQTSNKLYAIATIHHGHNRPEV